MYSFRPGLLTRKLYPQAVWRAPSADKDVYLTFDDGPHPEITPWVLTLLKKHLARATFFCVGKHVNRYPEIFRQIISGNHSIGNHTFDHLNGWTTPDKKYFNNISACGRMLCNRLAESFNPPLCLFRPPYGKMKQSQYRVIRRQYKIIMWDLLSGDFDRNLTPEKCLRNLMNYTRNGSIIVFHDSEPAKEKLFNCLPKYLDYLVTGGFSMKPL